MFGLEDYTWYSQPDGSIWLGSWPDCHWASRPISVTPKLYCGEKAATGVQIPMLPAIRPESQVNGKRISQLMFDGEQLTLQWKQPESQTQREMKQQFPELGTQTHLAQLGRVVAICEPVKAGHRQTPYRPALGSMFNCSTRTAVITSGYRYFRTCPCPAHSTMAKGNLPLPSREHCGTRVCVWA